MTMIVAGFVVWMNMTTPQVFLHPERFSSIEECRTKGTPLFEELKKTVTDKDALLGECLVFPQEAVDADIKKQFISKLKLNNTQEIEHAPSP